MNDEPTLATVTEFITQRRLRDDTAEIMRRVPMNPDDFAGTEALVEVVGVGRA